MPDWFAGEASLFTSFGYVADDRDDLRILQNLFTSLEPGAPLVMDVVSKERSTAGSTAGPTMQTPSDWWCWR